MKDIDKLIETVFEGSHDELSGLDRESQREVDLLRIMRDDLKLLRDVPECQLTTAHLREAVLNQKPMQPANPLRKLFLLSPMAVAAGIALVFMMSRPVPGSMSNLTDKKAEKSVAVNQPVVVQNPEVKANDSIVADNTDEDFRTLLQQTLDESPSQPAHITRRVSNSVGKSEKSSTLKMEMASASNRESKDEARFDSSPAADAPVRDMAKPSDPELTQEPVVIVSENSNSTTGAVDATEVSKPSDVVFGG